MEVYTTARRARIIAFILVSQLVLCRGWHEFDNAPFHCWPITADALNSAPIECEGIDMRWIEKPGDTLKAQEPFNMTYELIVSDSFYTWTTVTNSFFTKANGTGFTNAADAKNWCESVVCPAVAKAKESNCCIWHVNVHSCPLLETQNGLCGPWIPPTGNVFTHSEVLVGPVDQGNWSSYVAGLYQVGVNSVIAHFKISGIHVALETKINVVPRAVCGDGSCEDTDGEDCNVCPADCGTCPLLPYQIALIAAFAALLVGAAIAVFVYFQYQKRKLLWDESWIIPFEKINIDDGLRGAFGSMIGSTMDLSTTASQTHSMALSAARRQVFTKTAMFDGRTCALRMIKKKEFSVTKDIRWEVKAVREADHANLCKFVGGSVVVPDVCILTEYCPKGSLSDVLLNDDVPLNWAFRFSFAADIARGMHYLHSHKLYHGRLKSNNCVVDDRWTVKIADFGLYNYRLVDKLENDPDGDDDDDTFYQEKRAQVYKAPEFQGMVAFDPTPHGDVYPFAILLIEIATRNDPYEDEDAFSVPPCWKPALPDLSPEMAEDGDDPCPCPAQYIQLIQACWHELPEHRPSYDVIKKTIHKINPNKLSPVDLMMALMEKYSKHLESIVADRTQDLVAEKAKTDRLLYSMLPKMVADDLRQGKPMEAETHDACTIYFSDIVGFTTISGASTPIQVVALLNKLYITFDEIIDKYDVYKVETIGDAYMVVSGIPMATPFHAREVANMALDLVDACRTFVIPHIPDQPLKIRVGLHSGPACAGVVGLKMPRYCLFGDTVNTASRMESNGEAYKIHISNFTYLELVKVGGYKLERRGLIPVKGKGDMLTWWLVSRDPDVITTKRPLPVDENHADMKSKDSYEIIESESLIKVKSSDLPDGPEVAIPVLNGRVGKTTPEKPPENGFLDFTDHQDNGYLFTPVELPATATDQLGKMRKISQISTSNDSGYTDRPEEGSCGDPQEILVRSCGSFGDLDQEEAC